MNESQITQFLSKIEMAFPVNTWIIEGIHIWPLVRLAIGDYLHLKYVINPEKRYYKSNKNLKMDLFKTSYNLLQNFFRGYIGDYRKNGDWNKSVVLIFSLCAERTLFIPNVKKWVAYVLGPIENALKAEGISVQNVEHVVPFMKNNFPRDNTTILISLHLFLLEIKRCLKEKLGIKKSNKEVFLDGFDDLLIFLDYKGIDSEICSVRVIENLVNRINCYAVFFENIIKRCGAKTVLTSDWRNVYSQSIALAAFRNGLTSIEIQHGFYGTDSYTHCFWKKIPAQGYEIMPTHYWCWSKGMAKAMNDTNAQGYAIGGFPQAGLLWHDKNNVIVREYERLAEDFLHRGKIRVLVSLQGMYSYEMYPKWFIEVIRDSECEIFWMLRKHVSRELSGQDIICSELEYKDNVDWKTSTNLPLLLLLQHVCLNVTLTSSTIIEAAMEGVPTAILDQNGCIRYNEQINNGLAKEVNSKNEFLFFLKECSTSDKKEQVWDEKLRAVRELIDIVRSHDN